MKIEIKKIDIYFSKQTGQEEKNLLNFMKIIRFLVICEFVNKKPKKDISLLNFFKWLGPLTQPEFVCTCVARTLSKGLPNEKSPNTFLLQKP